MARQPKGSMFRKLFVSYVIIFAIPLLILGSLIYYLNAVSYQREVSEANLTKLTQVRNQIDLELKSLREIIYHLSSQSDIYSVFPDPEGQRNSLIVPQLLAYKNHYPFIHEILFYYRGDTKVYLSSGVADYFAFEHSLNKDYDWAGAGFFRELNAVSSPKSLRVVNKRSLSGDQNVLAFLFPVPFLKTIPQGTVLFTIRETEFLSKFQNIFGNFEGAIFIYDPYYQSLVSLKNNIDNIDPAGLEERLRTIRGTGVFPLTAGNKDLIVTRMVSEETDWSYIIAMPDSYFYRRVNFNSSLIAGLIVFLVVVGFLGALIFSFRNYKPIRALLSYFKKHEDAGVEGKSEFEFIRFTFENALKQNKEMLVQMNAQRPFVKDQCLLTLLQGKAIEPSERDYLIKCSNLMLKGSAYFSMVLSVRRGEAKEPELGHVIALLERIYFTGGQGYGVEILNENYIAVLVILQDIPADAKNKQLDIAERLVQLAKDNLDIEMIVGIGKIYRSIEQVNASYLEASAVLFDNQINDKHAIHFFDDIENSEEQVNWYPIKEQALFLQSLKQGDQTVAMEALRTMVEQLKAGSQSYFIVRCLCFDMVNHILKAVNQMNFQSFSGEIKELVKFNSLQEFQTGMEGFIVLFCKEVNLYKEKKNAELKNSIISYINEHFKDSNLSLEHIAQQFGLSASYLSRFIKEETGVNFMEYLTSLRMNEVKHQLQNTDKQIQEIVMDVGYLNIPSFVRKFKAAEGVTPGQYRQMTGKVQVR